MKRDIVQNFLRIILMTGLLFILGTQSSIGAEEKSSQAVPAYGSDVSKAMELLMEAAHEHESVLESPEASVTFTSFDDNSLKLTLRAFISSVDNRIGVITDLHQDINSKFNESGISIAFPQRDVHFDISKPIDIRMHRENDSEE